MSMAPQSLGAPLEQFIVSGEGLDSRGRHWQKEMKSNLMGKAIMRGGDIILFSYLGIMYNKNVDRARRMPSTFIPPLLPTSTVEKLCSHLITVPLCSPRQTTPRVYRASISILKPSLCQGLSLSHHAPTPASCQSLVPEQCLFQA